MLARTAARLIGRLRTLRASARRPRARSGPIRTTAATLPSAAARIVRVREETARQFAEVGDRIAEVSDLCLSLVRETEVLLSATGDRGGRGSPVQETAGIVESTLGYIESCHPKFEVVLEHLRHCDRQIDDILRLQSEWARVVAPLKHIRTLCRIEAAVLPAEMAAMFLALTSEIEQIEDKVGAVFAERFALLHSMQETLRQLARHLETVLPEQRAQSRDKRSQIGRALRTVEEQLAGRRAQDAALAAATRAISDTVGQLVVALQSDDIVAQKSAHLSEALAEMTAAATPAATPADLGHVHRLARIQSAQLVAIETDLAQAQDVVSSGFTRIISDVAQMGDKFHLAGDGARATPARDGTVQVLLDALGESERLVQATVREATAGFARLNPLGEMTAALTAAMSELAVSMHLIALNAQIQAIQHGRRTGLEVLAARMAEISRGISTVSHQALGALDDLSGRVRATITEFGRLCTDGEQHIRTREVEWRDRAADLRSLRDSSARAMAALGEKSAAVATVSRRIVEGFRVHASAHEELGAARTELDRIAAATSTYAGVPAAADTGIATAHARRYTMASERAIHEAVAATPASPAPAPAGTAPEPKALPSLSPAGAAVDFF
jgi:hypothetical protein